MKIRAHNCNIVLCSKQTEEARAFAHKNGFMLKDDFGLSHGTFYRKVKAGQIIKVGEYLNVALFKKAE